MARRANPDRVAFLVFDVDSFGAYRRKCQNRLPNAFGLHEIKHDGFRVIPRNDVRHRVCFGALGEKAPPKRG